MPELDYIPEPGDIVWIQLDPRVGREQSGRRPALILSVKLLATRLGLAIICPITSRAKGLPFEILLEDCKTKGVLLPIHIRSVDILARETTFIEKVSPFVIGKVTNQVSLLLGL